MSYAADSAIIDSEALLRGVTVKSSAVITLLRYAIRYALRCAAGHELSRATTDVAAAATCQRR